MSSNKSKLLWAILGLGPLFSTARPNIQIERPLLITSDKALYKLFREHLLTTWPTVPPGSQLKGKVTGFIDPIPIYMIAGECLGRKLIVVPFERLRFHYRDKNPHDAGDLWRNSKGATLLLVYAVDFKRQEFKLLFNERQINFHGSVVRASDSLCPDLVVTLFNPSSQGVIYSRLVYSESRDRYEIAIPH